MIRCASFVTILHPVLRSSSPVSRPRVLTRAGLDAGGVTRRTRTSSAWSEPADSIRVERAESSRPLCSTGLCSINGSKSFARSCNGRAVREFGGSSTRASSPSRGRSPPTSGLRDRPKVLEELGPLFVLRDLGARDLREFQTGCAEPRLPCDRERSREGFV